MKYLILIIVLIVGYSAKSQSISPDSLSIYKHNFHPIIQLPNIYQYYYLTTPSVSDNSVLKLPSPALTYKDNNYGLDIYQSTPDNMYVVKPDSTVAFTMPVKNFMLQTEPVK